MSSSDHYHVAIVGGGVAGCYCAARLAAAHPTLRVVLLEGEAGVGGRLHSTGFPGVKAPVELGGAFVTDLHGRTMALLASLGLALTPIAWSRRFCFIRGQRATDRAFRSALAPYAFEGDECGRAPIETLLRTLETIVPEFHSLWPMDRSASPDDARQGLQQLHVRGRLLDDWDINALLREFVSDEAHRSFMETFGSAANFRETSAYDAIRTLMGELTPQQAAVVSDGFQRLPEALSARSGAEVRAGSSVVKIVSGGDGVRLSLHESGDVIADRVILALPPSAIETIELEAPPQETQRFKAALANVRCVPAFKLYLAFDRAWWPTRGQGAGIAASFTDLPMQQCYYFDHGGDGAALMLAVFADDDSARFWLSRSEGRATAGPSREVVGLALSQLRAMHPDCDIPPPTCAVARAWPGAWHAWKPGARSWRSARAMLGPHLGLPVYVCGEAYSEQQGWVEGALESADHLLKLHFDVDYNLK